MNKANPEMLVLARELRGLTQAQLAEGVGLTQASISRYESGQIEIPAEHVRVFAKFLERPESFFYWQERLYGASGMYHRKNRRLSVAELTAIHSKVNLLRIQASRLLRHAKVTSKYSFHRLDTSKYGDPAECARRLRHLWQLPPGPVLNVVRAIERAGGMVFRCPFGNVRVDGVSQWPMDAPDMPPVFFVHEDIPGDRERLTLCHEIGHVVMHHMPTEGDLEEEANSFAAEFLMPADEIGADLADLTLPKAAALKAQWKVSMQAIIVHARRLKRITEGQYQYLFRQLSTRGYRKCEPGPIPAEEPAMRTELGEFFERKLKWPVAQLSEFLGETEENYRELYGHNFSKFRLVG